MIQAAVGDLPLFRRPEPELELRDRVLEDLAERRAHFVTVLRDRMAALYLERRHLARLAGEDADAVYVTSTDVREEFESLPNIPPPDKLSRNFLGTIFRSDAWEACGVEPSTTPGRRGALIRRWRYVGTRNALGPGQRGSERPRTGPASGRGDAVRPRSSTA